jgi:hypothetical protein
MSRARLGTELFVTAGAFEQGLGPEAREVEPLARTAARLAVSRAKVLASSHLEDGPTDGYGPAISAAPGRGRGPGNPELAVAPETGRRAARRVESTPDELRAVDHPGSQPPAHVAVLGPRPDSLDERARYDRLTDAINRYRVQYEVDDGDDPLGPRPFEARARLAHDVLAAEIRRYEPRRGRQLEPPGLDLGWGR